MIPMMTYTCAAGDSFDGAALEIYGDEKYAAFLLQFNPELCGKLVFEGGEKLAVPIVDIPDDDERTAPAAAPWRQ